MTFALLAICFCQPSQRPVPKLSAPKLAPYEEDWAAAEQDQQNARRAELIKHKEEQQAQLQHKVEEENGEAERRQFDTAMLLGVFVPAPLLFLVVWGMVGVQMGRYYMELEHPHGLARSDKLPWRIAVERMRGSSVAQEAREHVLLGTSLHNDYPILLDRAILNQHGHILGDTGARKTALGIAPLATQLIGLKDSSVVVLDLKGETSLFHSLWLEAENAGLPFRWFSIVTGHSSFVFNPFLQSHWKKLTVAQQSDVLLEAFSLNYGSGYGRSYFTAMNEKVLQQILRQNDVRSFQQLAEIFEHAKLYGVECDAEDLRKAEHLSALVRRFATVPALNATPEVHPERAELFQSAIDASGLLGVPASSLLQPSVGARTDRGARDREVTLVFLIPSRRTQWGQWQAGLHLHRRVPADH